MFYLRREMEERDAGKGPEAALEAAAATSGRAVLISGFTVIVAMAGMFLAGTAVFLSFGVGTILVVAVAVLGSVTVLPAMLSWLGQKGWTEKGRVPYLGRLRHRNHGESRVWGAILDRVLKRPVVSVVLAGGLMLALAIPAFGMHTINPGVAGPAAQPADHADLRPHPGEVPGRPAAGVGRRPGRRRQRARGPGRHRRAAAGGRRHEGLRPADHHHDEPGQRRSRSSTSRSPATAPTRSRRRRSRRCATTSSRRRSASVQRRRGQRDRHDRRLEGLQRHDEVAPADRVRVRARARVRPAARDVPVDRDPDQGDRAQPAVGRRRLRHPHARLPGRARREPARLPLDRRRSRRGCRCSCS